MAFAVAAMAACDKSVPYEPGAPMDPNGPNVYFSAYNPTDIVLASDATEFELAVLRDDATSALSVPLKAVCAIDGLFTAPETVEFEAGVDSVAVKVQVGAVEMFTGYQLTLSVPEEYTHAYAVQEVGPTYMANIIKEDYAPYANGMYYDAFYSGNTYVKVLEYSPLKNDYRISDPWLTGGEDITFTWDGSETVTLGSTKYVTGIVHASYGGITANVVSAGYYTFGAGQLLEQECNAFQFNFKWTVSAGSFGEAPNLFIVTEVLQ